MRLAVSTLAVIEWAQHFSKVSLVAATTLALAAAILTAGHAVLYKRDDRGTMMWVGRSASSHFSVPPSTLHLELIGSSGAPSNSGGIFNGEPATPMSKPSCQKSLRLHRRPNTCRRWSRL